MEKIYLLFTLAVLILILFRLGISIIEMRKHEPRVEAFIVAAVAVLMLNYLIILVLL